jgi:hypothetical protein
MKRTIFFILLTAFTLFMSIAMFSVCYNSLNVSKFIISALPLVLTAVCLFELTIANPIFKK